MKRLARIAAGSAQKTQSGNGAAMNALDFVAVANAFGGSFGRNENVFFYYRGWAYFWDNGLHLQKLDPTGALSGNSNVATVSFSSVAQPIHHPLDDIAYFFADNVAYALNDTTWEGAVLTLPSNEIITCGAAHGNYLAIATVTQGNFPRSKVYLWDRDSSLTTVTQLKNEALAIPNQLQLDATGRGITANGLAPIQTAALRNNSIKALSVSSLFDATNGLLASAQDKANKAVAAKYDPIQEQIDAATANLKLILADPQTSIDDKNRAQAQLDAQKTQQNQLDTAKQNAADVLSASISAAKNGADAATLQKMQSAPDGQTALQIAAAAGYGTSDVNDLITKYPDAGIQQGDTLQQAQQKVLQSPTYTLAEKSALLDIKTKEQALNNGGPGGTVAISNPDGSTTNVPADVAPYYNTSSSGVGYVDASTADPDDTKAFKKIARKYFTPTFIIESGTALDIPPALVKQSVSIAQAIVASPDIAPQAKIFDLTVILNFLKSLFFAKVGSSSPSIMFSNDSKFWNWLVVSSEDPTKVAATVKGAAGVLVTLLALTIHGPDFSSLPSDVYTVVIDAFGVFSAALALVGAGRKIYNTFFPSTQ